MSQKHFIPQKLRVWIDARKKYHLSHTQIQMARELGMDPGKTNLYGSGIALGHPVGCTGARIVITLISVLKERDARLGLASLCIGGGQGIAMVIERMV